MRWVSISGLGKLYARTTIHAAPDMFQTQVPYSVGIIDLEEGILRTYKWYVENVFSDEGASSI